MTAGSATHSRFRAARALMAEMAATSPRRAAAGAVLLLVLTVTEGAGVLLLAPLLELVGVMEDNPLPRAVGWLDAVVGAVGVTPTIGSVLLLFVGIAALRALFQRWQSRLIAGVREELTSATRTRLYRAMAAAEWRFLVTRTPAEFAHVLTSEISRVGQAVTHLTELAVSAMVSLVYLGLALRLSPAMAVLVLTCAAVLAWAARGSLNRARAVGARASGARRLTHGAIVEHVASIKTARSFGNIERHAAEFANLSRDARDIQLEVAAGETDLQQGLELGSTILLALIVYASVTMIHVPPALLLVLLFIFARLMPRLISIYRLVQGLSMALPVFEAVRRLEQECREAAESPAIERGELALNRSVQFDAVSFRYLRREGAPAVDGLNLTIAAGETTAIVGASGSGKSTVADLLMGLLTPASGRLLVDGEPLAASGLALWRRQIGYVPQDAFLFHDTVRANLYWARPEASDDELWEALRLAAADRFVAALPAGLDTIVGERGVLVSGGERQRLAIARALVRRPQILILDEATSSLDTENERRIQQAVDALHHRLTIVVITHRLATIRHADVIHVLEAGRVVQSGTWQALLMQRQGRFVELAAHASDEVGELA